MRIRRMRGPVARLQLSQPPSGITGMPFTRNCVPETITLSPAFKPRGDGIVVAHRVAQRHRRRVRNGHARSAFCTTKTKLCPPCRVTASTGTTAMGFVLQITRAFTICALRSISASRCTGAFTRIPCSVLSTWGEMKSILRLLQQLAVVVRQIHSQPHAHLAGALRGNVDVRLEILVLIHRGQHRRRVVNVVAHVHRDVAHHAVKRRADGVVGQQLLLRLARFHRRLVICLGVLVGLLRLVVGVAAGHACVKQLVLAIQLDRVVVEERLLLPLRGALRRRQSACCCRGSISISPGPPSHDRPT